MAKFNCPSCGAEIEFLSPISVYTVCKSCGSMVVRNDKNVEAIGKMAQLPDEITPLQIGTGGRYKDKNFTLIGRARMAWDAGFWNEWFMYIDDGTKAWLAEAQGNLAVCFEVDAKQKDLSAFSEVGKTVQINGKKFTTSDIKKAECVGSEGELPYQAPKGRKVKYVDMSNRDGEFASVEFSDNDQRIYTGEYVEFRDLNLSNLRELDGWSPS